MWRVRIATFVGHAIGVVIMLLALIVFAAIPTIAGLIVLRALGWA